MNTNTNIQALESLQSRITHLMSKINDYPTVDNIFKTGLSNRSISQKWGKLDYGNRLIYANATCSLMLNKSSQEVADRLYSDGEISEEFKEHLLNVNDLDSILSTIYDRNIDFLLGYLTGRDDEEFLKATIEHYRNNDKDISLYVTNQYMSLTTITNEENMFVVSSTDRFNNELNYILLSCKILLKDIKALVQLYESPIYSREITPDELDTLKHRYVDMVNAFRNYMKGILGVKQLINELEKALTDESIYDDFIEEVINNIVDENITRFVSEDTKIENKLDSIVVD